ncbi:Fic family protein [Taibaiella helva]|uniref:hypothetical protein n=1 Tax=Taibaiella helva TaxID=2301235 RepID=UPI0018E504B1|nr:hypothetical protein [Taibaiella helva]
MKATATIRMALCGLTLAGLSLPAMAQMKIGANPSQIVPGAKLQVDGNNTTTTPAKLLVDSAGKVGIGTAAPGTSLDVNGAITQRETAVAVSGNAATIPDNTSQVQLTGAATAAITLTAPAAPNAGQRLVIFNNTTGGFPAVLNGTQVAMGRATEFIYSNSAWQATGSAGAAATGNGIEQTSLQTIKIIEGIKNLMLKHKKKIREHTKFYSQDLINNLFNHPYTKIDFVITDLEVSRLTAAKYLDELDQIGIVQKVKLGRDNYYINTDLYNLLSNVNQIKHV